VAVVADTSGDAGGGTGEDSGDDVGGRRAKRARELSRARERSYPISQTGRHHHLGAAPAEQPVYVADGVSTTATAPVQMAERTTHHLQAQRSYLARRMEQAAAELDFEDAATCRDAIAALDAELARRERGAGAG
jgi:excinuclease UvrABC helicase subunit UvrB